MAPQAVLYVDYMSQPSRACILLCKLNDMDIEFKLVLIHKKQQRSTEYKEINPLGKVPCLREGEFWLPESTAILRYLAVTRHAADHWYPADAKRRARVDALLDWYHGNVRSGAAGLVRERVLWKTLGLAAPNEAAAKQALSAIKWVFKITERLWLADGPYLAGDEICVADLLWACEFDMLRMLDTVAGSPKLDELLEPAPRVRAWRQRVADRAGPAWTEVTRQLDTAVQRGKQRLQQQQQQSEQQQSKL